MGELGWLGLPFPEAVGGLGGSFVDAALVLEQLGTTLVPEPYVAVAGRSAAIVLRAGSAEQQQRWLAPMIDGRDHARARATPRRRQPLRRRRTSRPAPSKTAAATRSTGEKRWVLNGHAADQLVVSARTSGDAATRRRLAVRASIATRTG